MTGFIGFAHDGRKTTLGYGDRSVSFVRIDDKDAANIGGYMLGFGLLLTNLAIAATSDFSDHGRLIGPLFSSGLEWIAIPVFLFVFMGLWFAPRASLALLITAVAFLVALNGGREALALHSQMQMILAFATWYGGVLISFALLYPYPQWQGLVLAYVAGTSVPTCLLYAQATPGPDLGSIVFVWAIALAINFFGFLLRNLHSYQQGLEGAHQVRFGD